MRVIINRSVRDRPTSMYACSCVAAVKESMVCTHMRHAERSREGGLYVYAMCMPLWVQHDTVYSFDGCIILPDILYCSRKLKSESYNRG